MDPDPCRHGPCPVTAELEIPDPSHGLAGPGLRVAGPGSGSDAAAGRSWARCIVSLACWARAQCGSVIMMTTRRGAGTLRFAGSRIRSAPSPAAGRRVNAVRASPQDAANALWSRTRRRHHVKAADRAQPGCCLMTLSRSVCMRWACSCHQAKGLSLNGDGPGAGAGRVGVRAGPRIRFNQERARRALAEPPTRAGGGRSARLPGRWFSARLRMLRWTCGFNEMMQERPRDNSLDGIDEFL